MDRNLHFKRYHSKNYELLWLYALGFFSFTIINSACFIMKPDIMSFATANLFLGVTILAIIKLNTKKKLPFISIQDSKLEYLCPKKDQIITVYAHEITNITTRFFELRIHTEHEVHIINLELITEEKARWEIKETIKQLASFAPTLRTAEAE